MLFLNIFQYKNHIWHRNKNFIFFAVSFLSTAKDPYNITENGIADQNNHGLVPLQEHLINQTTNPHVTRIRGAPCKRRMKNGIEMFKKIRNPMNLMEGNMGETNQTQESNQTGRQQRRCLLCGKPGHYQKKCPNGREGY